MIFKIGNNRLFTAIQSGIANPGEPFICKDFNGDEVPARGAYDYFYVCDFHIGVQGLGSNFRCKTKAIVKAPV